MKKHRRNEILPPWGTLPTELVQDICACLQSPDLASASLTCRAWRAAACALVTHITLPLNHPLLIAGPAKGWEEAVARMSLRPHGSKDHGSQTSAANPPPPRAVRDSVPSGPASGPSGPSLAGRSSPDIAMATPSTPMSTRAAGRAIAAGAAVAGVGAGPGTPAQSLPIKPLPRLRTDFPYVTHITLVHNAMLHRSQVHAALSTLRALWPGVRGLSVHDSVTWDLPLDYSALGVLTHITSLELLFQGQGGMDEAGQPMYRASMPHLCRLSQLKELCMKWIIGYDVDSFLDFNEVYDLLASLVRHAQLRSLQFGGENINAEGARHLASITSLETLNLVCDARPASPLHLLDLFTMPRLTRLELMHVCPDHAWNAEPLPGEPADPLAELARRAAVLAASPLRCLALSLSPRCQALVSRVLPLLPHLHSLSVRVTSSDEEEALCAAFRAMQAGTTSLPALPPDNANGQLLGQPPVAGAPAATSSGSRPASSTSLSSAAAGPPPLRSLRLETAELGADLIASVASLTALTSLQLPRGLPSGETGEYNAVPAAAGGGPAADQEAAPQPETHTKYSMVHLSALGRLTNLRRLMVQMDSPSDVSPAFVDGSLVSVLAGLPHLESLHLSTWNLLGLDPTAEALGAYPDRSLNEQEPEPQTPQHHVLAPSAPGHDNKHQSQTVPETGVSCGQAAATAVAELSLGEEQATPAASTSGGGGATTDGSGGAAAGAGAAGGTSGSLVVPTPSLAPLPTWAWRGLRSLSLTHWPCVYGKLREVGPPQPGRCYAMCWDDLPGSLEALLLVRCQLSGSKPPPKLRHMWLADCICSDCPLPQLLPGMTTLETLILRWPSTADEQEGAQEAGASQREQLVGAVRSLKGLRTLGLGGIRCEDVPALAPLSLLRHLMLEPLQPQRPPGDAPSSQRDLTLLDELMALRPGGLAGLRTLWLPNWSMPIKQLLQWQQMLQVAMPLVVLRVTEYDVVWTVPTPVMHVAQVEAPSSLTGGPALPASRGLEAAGGGATSSHRIPAGSNRRHAGWGLDGQELEWWHIGCWTVQ